MSCYFKHQQETTITIPSNVDISGTTYYNIHVSIGNVNWTVRHRYKEFVELHTKLVNGQSIGRDLLPPKKVIGNRSLQFLDQRQKDLEKYLQKVQFFLQQHMCREFVEFLELNKYDIVYLLQDLANTFFQQSELLLQFFNKRYEFSVLEVHAISERLKLPCPANDTIENIYDFTHVVDFCSQIERLTIRPRNKRISESASFFVNQNSPIGTSNIFPGSLTFDLVAFKNLKTLQVFGINVSNITNMGSLRQTIQQLAWHNTSAMQINEFLLCDRVHKDDAHDENIWPNLENINLSDNKLTVIDSSIKLAPNLKTLVLDQNQIKTIENLSSLPYMQTLSLCDNQIARCIDLHLILGGNLIHLNLSQNNLQSLEGFRKLFTLVKLDVSCNAIDSIDEVDYVANLPCLEELILTGNPIAGTVDYRSRVLARFDDRINDIYLDNEKGNAQEIDTALALSALRQSENLSALMKQTQISPNKSLNSSKIGGVACDRVASTSATNTNKS
ncbi:nischarin [Contarinia nasturtii]|uniref:nischarin n=1 Tax=Contarinia nasturtii TaxID=265458 RepID=UPI0012D49AED|nr:nischarin [Contarinia nasturtii]